MGLEDELKRIRQTMESIESRIKMLEERALGGASVKPPEQVRMILMGPPGAGGFLTMQFDLGRSADGM
jgi:hypothetical protein